MISSEKNKDLWIEDYIKRVKVLSAQEIKLLETSWSSENNKVEIILEQMMVKES